jgi:hypothetical protein
LAACAHQRIVKHLADAFGELGLLGFEDKRGATVAVDEAV